jgi:hypothetical protein
VDGFSAGVLVFDTNAAASVFNEVKFTEDQHCLRRCDRLREMVIEVLLNWIVFTGTFTGEPSNIVFVMSNILTIPRRVS